MMAKNKIMTMRKIINLCVVLVLITIASTSCTKTKEIDPLITEALKLDENIIGLWQKTGHTVSPAREIATNDKITNIFETYKEGKKALIFEFTKEGLQIKYMNLMYLEKMGECKYSVKKDNLVTDGKYLNPFDSFTGKVIKNEANKITIERMNEELGVNYTHTIVLERRKSID